MNSSKGVWISTQWISSDFLDFGSSKFSRKLSEEIAEEYEFLAEDVVPPVLDVTSASVATRAATEGMAEITDGGGGGGGAQWGREIEGGGGGGRPDGFRTEDDQYYFF